jgi:hypothetical protein
MEAVKISSSELCKTSRNERYGILKKCGVCNLCLWSFSSIFPQELLQIIGITKQISLA